MSAVRDGTVGYDRRLQRLERVRDDEARNELAEKNWNLVRAVCKRLMYRIEAARVDPDDVIGAGWFGLLRAAELYEEIQPDGRRIRFSTYANYWIEQYMVREMNSLAHCNLGVSIDAVLPERRSWQSRNKTLADCVEEEDGETNVHVPSSDLRDLLCSLKPRYRHALECRFVLNMALHETGRELGVSRERARQIIEQALKLVRKRAQEIGLDAIA